MTTLLPNLRTLGHNIGHALGLVFDEIKDKDELPVVPVRRQTQTPTRTKKDPRVRTMADGKDYLITEDIDEQTGTGTITLDSENVHVQYARTPTLTKYDKKVFSEFLADQEGRYNYFNIGHYELLKKVAWSKKISYRAASKLKTIKNLDGCGMRRCSDYYKAINRAHNLSREN